MTATAQALYVVEVQDRWMARAGMAVNRSSRSGRRNSHARRPTADRHPTLGSYSSSCHSPLIWVREPIGLSAPHSLEHLIVETYGDSLEVTPNSMQVLEAK
jgi:hypothetical protein